MGYDNLKNRRVLKTIADREQEIREAMLKEEHIRDELRAQTERIDADIEQKEEDIENLRREKKQLEEGASGQIANIWRELGLPAAQTTPSSPGPTPSPNGGEGRKARNVRLDELVNAGLLRDGASLYFYHPTFRGEEEATVIASSNKLRYNSRLYSISKLALVLLQKHGFKNDKHSVAGPRHWKTREGKLLDDLNSQIRAGN